MILSRITHVLKAVGTTLIISVLAFAPFSSLVTRAAPPENGLYGMVINEYESSIVGARVEVACDYEGEFDWERFAFSDSFGEFAIYGSSLGSEPMEFSGCQDGLPLYVRATAEGYTNATPQLIETIDLQDGETFGDWAERVLSPARNIVFVLEEGSNAPADGLYGIIDSDNTGLPIEGATITISCDTQDSSRLLATTTADGYYEASSSEIVSQLNSIGCYYDSQFNVVLTAEADGYHDSTYTISDVQSADMAASFEDPSEVGFSLEQIPPPVETYFAGGDGTENNPFIIDTSEAFMAINRFDDTEGVHFALEADISMVDEEENIYNDFKGTLDGRGHSISGGVWVLFNIIDGGTVRNLFVSADIETGGEEDMGLLAKEVTGETYIENVHVSGSIVCDSSSLCRDFGGLVGEVRGQSTIHRSSASVNISKETGESFYFGGLVGLLSASTITESVAAGDVTARRIVGGLVGYVTSSSLIADSYAMGDVHAYADMNGIAGGLVGITEGRLLRTYATGRVSSDTYSVGGLVGSTELSSASIEHSFAAPAGLFAEGYAGGLVGNYEAGSIFNTAWVIIPDNYAVGYVGEYTDCALEAPKGMLAGEGLCNLGHDLSSASQLMENGYNGALAPVYLDSENAWDFEDVWGFDEGINDGLPYLRWDDIDEEDPEPEPEPTPTPTPSRGGGGGSRAVATEASATIAALQAQLQALIAQLTALGGTVSGAPSVPTVSARDLENGMQGDDVRALQTLLIGQGYAIPAGVTGFFAGQTQTALAAYQAARGIVPAVGYFGALTRAQMKTAGLAGLWW